jgi:hypothetical protein
MDTISQLLPIQWSRHRLRENPRLGIIALGVTLLCVLIVLYTLGTSAISLTLIVVFIFSLRSVLFPKSFLIDHQGWHISSILTGANAIHWDRIKSISTNDEIFQLQLSSSMEPIKLPLEKEKLADLRQLVEAWQNGWRPDDAFEILDDNQGTDEK